MNHKKLLILCCHGVYHKGEFYADRPQEKEVYQGHIGTAFNALKAGKYDTLIISGGCSKPQLEKSEARGYLDWADELGLARTGLILLEEFSRSSAENLLFSMCRFYQYFDYFPEEVGSCTLFWKEKWHKEVIAPALQLRDFTVETVQNERQKLKELQAKYPTERVFSPDRHTIAEITKKESKDPLELLKNVEDRDLWKKGHPYANINQEFRDLFGQLAEIGRQVQEAKSREEDQEKIRELVEQGTASLKYPWVQ